ncbi:putative reverse transcriptase zinc-binding domain-containing protein [Helianthus annuus]|uniref:uncharacterized protein LOC110874876 n=1 Tax=Helianthus annuus TaxID=4232 RepID=UPI0016531E30|nr:uncharacterized protein LOC110874876 [Helianthus annuus]KAJ0527213.1 putative reverse transcriptase zinc-binding domain-containing protein [Helianthus annuus]KAJ0543617.1 putative reverse transcriptase zinc-binding domain-containing protein [Helianthus annuus]KAJ0708672.1 putative reverse transcriptase zinc-binding domain-containing protein [Helianthus annuus]KAJ0712587.1 putative reverse transcriptase zinc-binding domain-containing protein [Helianthus annuus]
MRSEFFVDVRISERVSNGSGQVSLLWKWKRPPAQGSEREELHQLNSLLESVTVTDRSDRWIWIGEGEEVFSIAAVKKTILKGRGSSTGSNFKWCKWVPVKCNVFAWRAVINRIPTVEALRRRNINIQNSICLFCMKEKMRYVISLQVALRPTFCGIMLVNGAVFRKSLLSLFKTCWCLT